MTITMTETTDGRLRRGDATRRTVLKRAVDIASIQGLEGLSIGQLAADLQISKSGLFAHFGAKEELQLATIRAARRIYADAVVAPAREAPPGLDRIYAMSEAWLAYSQGRVFPGGCFFAKATHDFAARPGRVRDALAAANAEWMDDCRGDGRGGPRARPPGAVDGRATARLRAQRPLRGRQPDLAAARRG